MFPHGKGPATLRDWDLWGPLLFCFFLGTYEKDVKGKKYDLGSVDINGPIFSFPHLPHSLLSFFLAAVLTISSEDATVFTLIFFIVALGSVVITLNAK